MITIESKFIGNFKTGDNINHNLQVLAILYRYFDGETPQNRRLLCKPIVISLISIIDAVLHDLHYRVREFKSEGVRNILNKSRDDIRSLRRMERLEATIRSAKKHGLIEPAGDAFYDNLDKLRELRNRVHIQNAKKYFPPNEYDAFTEPRKLEAERAVEKTLKVMAKKYARDYDFVESFQLPWNPHYPSG